MARRTRSDIVTDRLPVHHSDCYVAGLCKSKNKILSIACDMIPCSIMASADTTTDYSLRTLPNAIVVVTRPLAMGAWLKTMEPQKPRNSSGSGPELVERARESPKSERRKESVAGQRRMR